MILSAQALNKNVCMHMSLNFYIPVHFLKFCTQISNSLAVKFWSITIWRCI